MSAVAAAKRGKRKGLSIEEKIVLVERWIIAHPQPFTLKELQLLIPKHTPVIFQSVEECVQLLVAEGRLEEERIGVHTLFWKFPLTTSQKTNADRRGGLSGDGLSCRQASSSGPVTSFPELLRRIIAGSTGPPQQHRLSAETVQCWLATVPTAQLHDWLGLLKEEHAKLERQLAAEQVRLGLPTRDGSVAEDHRDNDEAMQRSEVALLAELEHIHTLSMQRAQVLAQEKSLASLPCLPDLVRQLQSATNFAREAANRWTDNYLLAEQEMIERGGFGGGRRDVRARLQLPPVIDYLSDEDDDDDAGESLQKSGENGPSGIVKVGEEEKVGILQKRTARLPLDPTCGSPPDNVQHGAEGPEQHRSRAIGTSEFKHEEEHISASIAAQKPILILTAEGDAGRRGGVLSMSEKNLEEGEDVTFTVGEKLAASDASAQSRKADKSTRRTASEKSSRARKRCR